MTSWSTAAPPPEPGSSTDAPLGGPQGGGGPAGRRPARLVLLGVAGGAALVVLVLGGVLGGGPGGGPDSQLPAPVLDGSAGYRFIHLDASTSLPSRFDPCHPVPFVINPDGAPSGAVEDVREAFRRAELATGIRFVDEGLTDEVPARDRAAHQPERYGDRWAPVLVGWVPMDPDEGEHIQGAVVGWAAHTPLVSSHRQDVVTTGTIALDADARSVRPGFGAGRRWGNVVLHEIGHLLGLDHADAPGEVMAASVDRGAGAWGPGDLAGLAHLGREAGCLRSPDPDQVDVQVEVVDD